jgi:hypothetical protein
VLKWLLLLAQLLLLHLHMLMLWLHGAPKGRWLLPTRPTMSLYPCELALPSLPYLSLLALPYPSQTELP